MINSALNPKLSDEEIKAQKIHLTVDYLTDNYANALIPGLRYAHNNKSLYTSQFLKMWS
jgi:hypothetical protein